MKNEERKKFSETVLREFLEKLSASEPFRRQLEGFSSDARKASSSLAFFLVARSFSLACALASRSLSAALSAMPKSR